MNRQATLIATFLAFIALRALAQPPPPLDGLDIHIAVAADHKPGDGSPPVLVHFHGAPPTVEKNFHRSALSGVLVVVNCRGLSSAYRRPFEDQNRFPRLLAHTQSQLKKSGQLDPGSTWGRVDVSCFSAGFGAVRELLKNDAHVARIDAVVAADSIHASIHKNGSQRTVDTAQMLPFLNFSKLAVAGQKSFIISYSQLPVKTYASTSETTHYLLGQLGLPEHKNAQRGDGFVALTLAEHNTFKAVGYPGKDGAAHLQHLRNISVLWSHLKHHRLRAKSPPPSSSSGG